MKRVSRRFVVKVIEDRIEAISLEPDDDTLAKIYEVLTLDDCAPDEGEFVIGD